MDQDFPLNIPQHVSLGLEARNTFAFLGHRADLIHGNALPAHYHYR